MSEERKTAIRQKLSETRAQLMSALDELDEGDWETVVYSEEANWTISDILRHLVDSERGMTGLMKQIRKGGEGVPADFDITRWNARVIEKASDKPAAELLAALSESRPLLLEFVESLTDAEWELKGRHASLKIMSIEEICHLIADHEQAHVVDIDKLGWK